ncbi:hypothetical protein [Inquilinus sp. Marseille-Q2685]|uniref:hypothetical protein n=1 Tax=Inquilinus sp. Marseille-Q2685 TaxID=2866581 RepID=UPI001CE4991E|nr:hypothetical protein [Inquilinus sp. Marseille-Q2685]
MGRSAGLLLRRLLTALSLAAALGFGLGPAAAPAADAGHDGGACLVAAGSQHPAAPGHHGGARSSPCCGMLCVPALAADDAPVPPPDLTPTGVIRPADTSEEGIEISGPSPPPRP